VPGVAGPPDRLRALAPIIVFDVAGPLAVYYGARSAGMSTVLALVVSGALSAVRVLAPVVQHRRLDAIGALVLSGIALETMGEGTAKGRAFAGMWQHAEFRRVFRVITVVWGLVFLAESAVQAECFPWDHGPKTPRLEGFVCRGEPGDIKVTLSALGA